MAERTEKTERAVAILTGMPRDQLADWLTSVGISTALINWAATPAMVALQAISLLSERRGTHDADIVRELNKIALFGSKEGISPHVALRKYGHFSPSLDHVDSEDQVDFTRDHYTALSKEEEELVAEFSESHQPKLPVTDFFREAVRIGVPVAPNLGLDKAADTVRKIAQSADDLFHNEPSIDRFFFREPIDGTGKTAVDLVAERGAIALLIKLDQMRFGANG